MVVICLTQSVQVDKITKQQLAVYKPRFNLRESQAT